MNVCIVAFEEKRNIEREKLSFVINAPVEDSQTWTASNSTWWPERH
jgi:hypothetical protein